MSLFKLKYLSLIPSQEICGVIIPRFLERTQNRRCQDTLKLFLSLSLPTVLGELGNPFDWIFIGSSVVQVPPVFPRRDLKTLFHVKLLEILPFGGRRIELGPGL